MIHHNTPGSTAGDTTSECIDNSLTELSSLLRNIARSGNENKVKEAVKVIFQNEAFKNTF